MPALKLYELDDVEGQRATQSHLMGWIAPSWLPLRSRLTSALWAVTCTRQERSPSGMSAPS